MLHSVQMSKRAAKQPLKTRRRRIYLREWRKAVEPKLSQEALALEVGVSNATISRLESGDQVYTQDVLDDLAAYFSKAFHRPVLALDLITQKGPYDTPGLMTIWSQATDEDRAKILSIAQTIVGTKQ